MLIVWLNENFEQLTIVNVYDVPYDKAMAVKDWVSILRAGTMDQYKVLDDMQYGTFKYLCENTILVSSYD